ncbi:hypothetical protein [Butyrivibrio sp.]|uniref:hypothetical protein n=1 Tax=Butyrivibrio sp. TaxID=28121 RepID=UPI0025C1092D|nr:hypothetical protein [Butyrivibrio sp.]MBQ7428420.1 hypothetical protein [Butyrivibrio sp.]MBQ9303352.1 hypothetical protein [Butyrivibrio sp.]
MILFIAPHRIAIPSELLEVYYRMEHRVVTPPLESHAEVSDRNRQLVASISANLASLGYRLSDSTVNTLLGAPEAEIVNFYQTYFPVIRDEIGLNYKNANLFYPGFPEQVAELDRAQIFLDQLVYGLSGFKVQPTAEHSNDSPEYALKTKQMQEEMPFLYPQNAKALHLIQSSTPYRLIEAFRACLQSVKPFTNSQREYVEEMTDLLYKNHVDITKILSDIENQMPCRENKAIFAAVTAHKYPSLSRDLMTDSKDVLRTAAVLSCMRKEYTTQTLAQAAALPKSVHFTVSRKDRRFLLNALDDQIKRGGISRITGDIWAQKELWKRFFKETHEREYSAQFQYADQLHTSVANNLTPHDRFAAKVEKAIAEQDVSAALNALHWRPGELFRRADKLIRIAESQGQDKVSQVFALLQHKAAEAGISTVVSLNHALQSRTQDETDRNVSYVFEGARKTVTLPEKKWRKAFNPETLKQLAQFQEKVLSPEGLAPRFAGKNLGKMYISPEMQYYTVPLSTRELSEGIEAFGHGSAINAISEHAIKRLFVQWTNLPRDGREDGRLDIDLSARVIFKDHITNIDWNRDYHLDICDSAGQPAVIYSGDVQDGGPSDGPGAAEYIDINVPALKENGAKYIIASVNSYTMQGYDKQPNTYFGWMDRDKQDIGKAFEPQSVQQRFKLTSKSTMENALVYDLEHDRIIWIDEPSMGRVMTESTQEADFIIQNTLGNVMTVEDLAKANALANEGQTEDLDEAEIALMTRQEYLSLSEEQQKKLEEKHVKIIFPSNLLALTTLLLADGARSLEREYEHLHTAIQGHDVEHSKRHEHDDLVR